jgi:Cu/Ag efflux pump CusA
VWPWLIVLIAFVVGGGRIQNAPYWLALPRPLYLLQILLLAGLVALFVHLYMRAQRIAGPAAVSALSPAVLASGLAAITFVEMAVATQLQGFLPLAGQLILVAVVALSILARWWQPPFEADSRYPTREEA